MRWRNTDYFEMSQFQIRILISTFLPTPPPHPNYILISLFINYAKLLTTEGYKIISISTVPLAYILTLFCVSYAYHTRIIRVSHAYRIRIVCVSYAYRMRIVSYKYAYRISTRIIYTDDKNLQLKILYIDDKLGDRYSKLNMPRYYFRSNYIFTFCQLVELCIYVLFSLCLYA